MGLVVTVDGSWEISNSFLVTWYNYVKRRIWDERDVIMFIILHDHVKKILDLAYLFVKY